MTITLHHAIPHESPGFLSHAIQAAKYATAARTAETIDALRAIEASAKNEMHYSPLGSSEETDAFYWAIRGYCEWRISGIRTRQDTEEALA